MKESIVGGHFTLVYNVQGNILYNYVGTSYTLDLMLVCFFIEVGLFVLSNLFPRLAAGLRGFTNY